MFIYKVTNKINNKAYIGQTIRPLNIRFGEHQKPSRNKLSILTVAIQKYGKDNFIIELLYTCKSLKQLDELEQYYITMFNTVTPFGYNLTLGGNQSRRSLETIEKYKLTRKLQKPPIPKGFKQPKEWALKKSIPLRKPVIGTNTKTGQIIEFESVSSCKSKFGKWAVSTISAVCLGKAYQAYGYTWKYKNEIYQPYKPLNLNKPKFYNRTAVIKIDSSNKETFYSGACELQKEGFDSSSVLKICKGTNLSSKGFRFRYATNEEINNNSGNEKELTHG